jgi:sigma-E factor negative regulatory protein RseA
MSEDIRQQLSALMDGELDKDSARFLMRRLDTDASLKAQWERMHLARGVLRRQDSLNAADGFTQRVMAQLQAEPQPRHVAMPRFSGWLKYGTGGAIAAGVAVAAMMLSHPVSVPNGPADAPTTVAVTPVAPRPSTLPGNFIVPQSPVPAQAVSYGSLEQPLGIDPRLQSYLMRHYEAAGSAGRSGVAPYVLLVLPASPEPKRSGDEPATALPQQR